MKRLRENEHITGYVFSAPFVLGFLIFTLYPILSSLYYSFTNYNLMEAPRWLGLGNYERLFLEDDKIGKSFQVTFTYVFASVPLRLIFALFVAMILNTATKAVGLYRSAFYLPSHWRKRGRGYHVAADLWRQGTRELCPFALRDPFHDLLDRESEYGAMDTNRLVYLAVRLLDDHFSGWFEKYPEGLL